MFEEHKLFLGPSNPEQVIWRYMDFTKYVDLLSTSSLYFTRADCFKDIFEGSIPRKTVEWRNNDELERQKANPKYILEDWAKHTSNFRKEIGINCWHINDYESAAMWNLYLKSNGGIAIQSTYNRLKTCFNGSEIVQIGKVSYIDYESDQIDIGLLNNSILPFLHKRRSFEHEHEIRAMIWSQPRKEQKIIELSNGGSKVPVELNRLIEKVYLSPESPAWFSNLVKDITRKHCIEFEIIDSKLNDRPFF